MHGFNRLTNVRENGAASGIGVLASYTYDELSRPTAVALGNGTNRTVDYKPDSSVWKVGLDLDQAATANDNLYTLAYNQIPQIASVTTTKARVCQYENSSNGDFLIDFHPRLANVLLVGGGSGHGFKHGPEVGRMAAERLLGLGKVEPRFSLASKSETHKREVI